ncbi:MAG: response regulator [Burkholderiales bacterium]|nr:response regulator [Burkholderiales bacterium]MDE2433657.1 response regulator [Burkholderiales bacterium]
MSATPESRPDAYRFLIVDDSRAIQAIVRRVVESCGYPNADIRGASNGEEALQMLETFKPQLVITDWHMPKVSGLELLQAMRQSSMTDIKVGFITTESSESMLNQARTNGATFVLNKPFKDDVLIQYVNEAVPLPQAAAPATTPNASPSEPEFPEPVARTAETPQAAADQAPAPPTAPTPTAPASAIATPPPKATLANAMPLMRTEDCQRLVHATLQEIPFRLIRHEDLHTKDLTAKNLIGLYAGPNKPIAALCVLDTHSICIFGGGAGKMPPHVVRAAMAAGAPSEAMVQNATRFMQTAGAVLHLESATGAIPLSRTSLVPQNFKKLEELLQKNSGSAHFRISVPGYGEGRFSFLAV